MVGSIGGAGAAAALGLGRRGSRGRPETMADFVDERRLLGTDQQQSQDKCVKAHRRDQGAQ
jgi:hypothetical protein